MYHPIFLNRDATLWCVVDPVDYVWASQYSWNYKPRFALVSDHYYAKRNVGVARTPVYLHRSIMELVGSPPSDKHIHVDHISGNTLDNRRANLRWATRSENRRNFGHKSFCIPFFVDSAPIPF